MNEKIVLDINLDYTYKQKLRKLTFRHNLIRLESDLV